jgi:hypothetical protein
MKRSCLFAVLSVLSALLFASVGGAQQFPVLDEVADKIVQNFQQSSCEQLWQRKWQPKSETEQKAVQALREDPRMREEFFRRVAVPIATKMFDCGLIP